jgi:cobalamin biosynthesis Mg chelatase CobN
MAVTMMDDAVLTVANLDESDGQNFIRKHLREYRAAYPEAGKEYDGASDIMRLMQNIFSIADIDTWKAKLGEVESLMALTGGGA